MRKTAFLVMLGMTIMQAVGQKQPAMVELTDPNSFTMVLLPDPQNYNKFDVNQPLLELQTAWIANQAEKINLKAVLCTGDIVEQNELRIPHGTNGNQTSEEQWKAASHAFERLDNKVNYILCTGNHDYGYVAAENRLTRFPHYFPVERNSCWRNSLVAVGMDSQGIPTLENAAYEIKTDTWGDILVVSIEFAPRTEILEWARDLASSDKYKGHKVIVLTHSYLDDKGELIQKEGYKLSPANYGQAIWDELVYPTENIAMVVCGHHGDAGSYEKNVSFRTAKNAAGKNVPQMMFNAQMADGFWDGNGGDCWLRIFEFMPDGKTIKVKTFSPLFAISPLMADKAWRTDSYDQFNIIIE